MYVYEGVVGGQMTEQLLCEIRESYGFSYWTSSDLGPTRISVVLRRPSVRPENETPSSIIVGSSPMGPFHYLRIRSLTSPSCRSFRSRGPTDGLRRDRVLYSTTFVHIVNSEWRQTTDRRMKLKTIIKHNLRRGLFRMGEEVRMQIWL